MDSWQFHALEDRSPVDVVEVDGVSLRPGDRVRLRPKAGGDIFDIALAGQTATIEAIEQDYDGRVHLAVVVDADPGRDFGCSVSRGTASSFRSRKWSRCHDGARVRRPTADGARCRDWQRFSRRRWVWRRGRESVGEPRVPARCDDQGLRDSRLRSRVQPGRRRGPHDPRRRHRARRGAGHALHHRTRAAAGRRTATRLSRWRRMEWIR